MQSVSKQQPTQPFEIGRERYLEVNRGGRSRAPIPGQFPTRAFIPSRNDESAIHFHIFQDTRPGYAAFCRVFVYAARDLQPGTLLDY